MKTLDFEAALELADCLARALGASPDERERIMRYDDDRLVEVLRADELCMSLFRSDDVVREFVAQPRTVNDRQRALRPMLLSGDLEEMREAREFIESLCGL
jgi:hypothetical protein